MEPEEPITDPTGNPPDQLSAVQRYGLTILLLTAAITIAVCFLYR